MTVPAEFERLQDLCEVFADGDWIETKDQAPSGIRLIQTGNVGGGEFKDREGKARFVSEATFKRLRCTEIFEGDCLISRLPDPVGRSCLLPSTGQRMITAVDCTIVRFKRELIEPKYFHYFSQSRSYFNQVAKLTTGATRERISRSNLGKIVVPRPPMLEQQRIVVILDETFAELVTATANAKKNLKNAHDLFDSYLHSIIAQSGEEWEEKNLGDVCGISSKLVDPRDSKFIDLPHLGAGNMISKTGDLVDIKTARKEGLKSGKYLFDDGMVLYSKIRPYLMKACRPNFHGLCSADVYPLVPDSAQLDRNFLFHLLMSRDFTDFAIAGSDRAGMPKVNRDHLFKYRVMLPDVETQAELASMLDAIAIEVGRIETIYQQKLENLAELKQSILQKAFSGVLGAARQNKSIESFQAISPNTQTTSFSASILAVAFEKHRLVNREKTFGRVKAQKLLHLVEAVAEIDLGRDPIKDAAGPNDFQHMLRVEEWAEQRAFFKFYKSDGRYFFQKLESYDKHLAAARAELQTCLQEITHVVDLLIPMNSEEAEVLATVYAAWNNLILDNKPITEGLIVHEARENWHSDKMDIPRERFVKAIKLLKSKRLAPEGKAKRVQKKYLI